MLTNRRLFRQILAFIFGLIIGGWFTFAHAETITATYGYATVPNYWYTNDVNWVCISMDQKLSEEFIGKYQDKVCWQYISAYQKLSEDFIEKHADKINWKHISAYQKLSEEFIDKYQDKVNWGCISGYQKLSKSFRKKHNVKIPYNDWLYTSTEDKINYIKAKTNYEIIDNSYIIAYKAIRSDNYSIFNFQYRYLPGNSYKSHCDCNLDELNSFGLAAWNKEGAIGCGEQHLDFKLIKVLIFVKDIGAITKSGKIRCRKFTVLNEEKQ
jgi:hypothetical protein